MDVLSSPGTGTTTKTHVLFQYHITLFSQLYAVPTRSSYEGSGTGGFFNLYATAPASANSATPLATNPTIIPVFSSPSLPRAEPTTGGAVPFVDGPATGARVISSSSAMDPLDPGVGAGVTAGVTGARVGVVDGAQVMATSPS